MKIIASAAAVFALAVSAPAMANHHSKGTIVDKAVASEQHATLVAAVKAADLVETLSGPGPFTLFAPTDMAFGKLPDGTVADLLKPESLGTLKGILTYHAVPGRVASTQLVALIQQGGGSAEITTVEGGKLVARLRDGKVELTDENGGVATVVAADIKASNGYVHVTDAVSLPK